MCIVSRIHNCSIIQNSFITLRNCLCLIYLTLLPLSLSPWKLLSFYCLYSSAFSKMSCNWNQTVYSVLDWLLLLSAMHLRFIHVFCDLIAHFFFLWIIFHCMDVPNFIHSLVEGHFGCFQFLVKVNKAAKNIHMQVFCVDVNPRISWVNT